MRNYFKRDSRHHKSMNHRGKQGRTEGDTGFIPTKRISLWC
jgi:hypothetical protein